MIWIIIGAIGWGFMSAAMSPNQKISGTCLVIGVTLCGVAILGGAWIG